MATSVPNTAGIALPGLSGSSLMEKLNSKWHERALQIFMVIVLAHWAEHLAQAYQIWVMGWPASKANGVLGLWYPQLIKSEVLHYGYAVVMLAGIWILRKGFTGRSYTWWMIAFWIQFWHHIEHLLLITQATMHHNFWGKPVPFSVIQLVHSARAAPSLLQLDCVCPDGSRDVLPHVPAGRRAAHGDLQLLLEKDEADAGVLGLMELRRISAGANVKKIYLQGCRGATLVFGAALMAADAWRLPLGPRPVAGYSDRHAG